jgi:hypothetical protein
MPCDRDVEAVAVGDVPDSTIDRTGGGTGGGGGGLIVTSARVSISVTYSGRVGAALGSGNGFMPRPEHQADSDLHTRCPTVSGDEQRWSNTTLCAVYRKYRHTVYGRRWLNTGGFDPFVERKPLNRSKPKLAQLIASSLLSLRIYGIGILLSTCELFSFFSVGFTHADAWRLSPTYYLPIDAIWPKDMPFLYQDGILSGVIP